MNKYYMKDLSPLNPHPYHCIGFSDDHLSYLYFNSSIADAKFHLLHYDFNNIRSWAQTTNGYEVTMCVYHL